MSFASPFKRANAMMAAIAAIVSAANAGNYSPQARLNEIGPYKSQGKSRKRGRGTANKVAPGAGMANIRAARKARNVRRARARS